MDLLGDLGLAFDVSPSSCDCSAEMGASSQKRLAALGNALPVWAMNSHDVSLTLLYVGMLILLLIGEVMLLLLLLLLLLSLLRIDVVMMVVLPFVVMMIPSADDGMTEVGGWLAMSHLHVAFHLHHILHSPVHLTPPLPVSAAITNRIPWTQ